MNWLFKERLSIWAMCTGFAVADLLGKREFIAAALVFIIAVMIGALHKVWKEQK